jgi:hypothetical protein
MELQNLKVLLEKNKEILKETDSVIESKIQQFPQPHSYTEKEIYIIMILLFYIFKYTTIITHTKSGIVVTVKTFGK